MGKKFEIINQKTIHYFNFMKIQIIPNICYVDKFSQLLFQILQSNSPLKLENSVRTNQHLFTCRK